MDRSEIQGTFGAPPADAPREVAAPLSAELVDAQAAAARANEQPLAPFNPQPPAPVTPAPTRLHALPRQAPPTHQPAASSTDSPSRGIPRPIDDPGKRITGGFGSAGEAQYFPLDGSELKELVRSLMDKLNARLDNDLRFHLAITYPRVRARVVIEVEAYATESGFEIEQIAEHTKTPLELAREVADRVAFVLVEARHEFADDGSAQDPPDRIREDLGMERPRKQQVDTPGGKIFVDRPTTALDHSF